MRPPKAPDPRRRPSSSGIKAVTQNFTPDDRPARAARAEETVERREYGSRIGAVEPPVPATAVGPDAGGAPVVAGVPAYDEADTIAAVVRAVAPHVDEVVVVDDGSTDGTAERARAAGATVLEHEDNRGYGATLGTIFEHADAVDAAHLVVLDGDGQHDADDVPKLVAAQRETGADIVVGSRFLEDSATDAPAYRRVGLAVVNALTNAGLRLRYSASGVSDTQSGFRAYNRESIRTVARRGEIGEGMEASLDLLFHAAREGLTVAEVPTTIDYDIDDPSTQNPLTHGLVLVGAILREIVPTPDPRATAGGVVAVAALGSAVGLIGLFGGTVVRALVFLVLGVVAGLGLAASNVGRALSALSGR
jgi:hypothetical protein